MLTPKLRRVLLVVAANTDKFEFVSDGIKVFSTVRGSFAVVDLATGKMEPHRIHDI